MSKLHRHLHLEAFSTHFELACIAGMLVIAADMVWLAHDILANGLSVVYTLIGSLMSIGLLWTGFITYRHHRIWVSKIAYKECSKRMKALRHRTKYKVKNCNF